MDLQDHMQMLRDAAAHLQDSTSPTYGETLDLVVMGCTDALHLSSHAAACSGCAAGRWLSGLRMISL